VDSKQSQKAGGNSQQMQAGTIIVNYGIDEKRVREILDELLPQAIKAYTKDALHLANSRVGDFENRLVTKMASIEGAFEAFADPGFQLLLVEAQKRAAASERTADYDLLSELLIHRFQKGENRNTRAGISRAVEIVDQISDEALLGLTVSHAVTNFVPVTGDILQGLDVLNGLFEKVIYNALPMRNDWLDHLDVLNAIRIESFGKLKKMEEYYPGTLDGYLVVGIEKSSADYQKASEMLAAESLPQNILVDNVLNNGYVRISIPQKKSIDSLCLLKGVQSIPLSDSQKEAIKSVYALYKNDNGIKNEVTKRFMAEWDKRQYLKQLREWWDNVGTAFQITSVGKVLAHTNAQRCDKTLPPLN
jgi:hypothetical protein